MSAIILSWLGSFVISQNRDVIFFHKVLNLDEWIQIFMKKIISLFKLNTRGEQTQNFLKKITSLLWLVTNDPNWPKMIADIYRTSRDIHQEPTHPILWYVYLLDTLYKRFEPEGSAILILLEGKFQKVMI